MSLASLEPPTISYALVYRLHVHRQTQADRVT